MFKDDLMFKISQMINIGAPAGVDADL